MKSVALKASSRTLTGRGGAKKLRASGKVPAVVYGRKLPTQSLVIDQKSIEDLLHHSASETVLVDLDIAGDSPSRQLALLQEVQHNPVSGRVLHVDFHQVAADEQVTVTLPVETQGEAAGVKAGGVLEHVLFKVKVRGLPKDLPEMVVVDVSKLEIGDVIHLGELPLPESVEALGDPGTPAVTVAAPRTEETEVETEEGAAEAKEPEIVGAKKEDEASEDKGKA